MNLEATQIIRDTLRGWIAPWIFAVLNSNFKAFGSKKQCLREQNKTFKRHFLANSFHISQTKNFAFKIIINKNKKNIKYHLGVRKVPKKCLVLFNYNFNGGL